MSLKVRPGDRVPMRKTIDTVLTQSRDDGTSDAHRTRTEIELTLTAEDVQPLQTQWAVRYDRVRVTRDMGGNEMVFEASPGVRRTTDDVEARAYQAMTQHGFSFTVDGTNRVTSVLGFDQFVTACLGGVTPPAGMSGSTTPSAAIADFVDPFVGVLPFRTDLIVGQPIQVPGTVDSPVPLMWTETLTIESLDPQTVSLVGGCRLSPSQIDGVSVAVLGGSIESRATVFRDSGLPQSARRTETIQMVARLSDGGEIPQTKTTVTTVEAFPRPTGQAF